MRITVTMITKSIGIELLKKLSVLGIYTRYTAGNSSLMCIGDYGVEYWLFITRAQREWIYASAVELREENNIVVDDCHVLPSPKIQIGK